MCSSSSTVYQSYYFNVVGHEKMSHDVRHKSSPGHTHCNKSHITRHSNWSCQTCLQTIHIWLTWQGPQSCNRTPLSCCRDLGKNHNTEHANSATLAMANSREEVRDGLHTGEWGALDEWATTRQIHFSFAAHSLPQGWDSLLVGALTVGSFLNAARTAQTCLFLPTFTYISRCLFTKMKRRIYKSDRGKEKAAHLKSS